MSALTITISSPGRAIVADGRLVAGESADVSVLSAVPAALYIVDASRDVVAACTSFVQGETSATGELNLATVPLAEIVAEVPAGRAIPLQAILEDAAGAVIGYGLVAVVSAPMPDALDPLDEDLIYAKLSDLRAYLTRAEADERYAPIDAATPVAPSVAPSDEGKPADAYQTGRQLAGKQATISDLAEIRAGAADGATAVQSVNGVTPTSGALTITGDDIRYKADQDYSIAAAYDILALQMSHKADAANLRYALDAEPRDPDPQTGAYQLDDRTINYIQTSATAVTVAFPVARTNGRARDFFVRLTSLSQAPDIDNMSIEFAYPNIVILTPGAEMPPVPLGAETILYFSEIGPNEFLLKGETVEVTPQTAQGGN